MRALARWGSLPLLATPFGTWALGLGEIELNSALNQPLDAEIELVSATPEELAGLDIALAPLASFQRYGLERPAILNSLAFELGRDAAGRNVIQVRSTQSITEPFVTMLIEARWPRGRLLREYTVFLDPPVLLPAPAAIEPVTPPQARTTEPAVPGGTISRASPAPAPATPAPRPAPPAAAPRQTPPAGQSADGSSYGPVRNAQTLWGIAQELRPAGASINQAMVAIYQANPDAFGGNMNHLRRGAILRIPPGAEMTALSAGNATAEVQRQNDAWQARSAGGAPQPRLVLVPPQSGAAAPAGGTSTAAAGGELAALRGQVADLEQQLAESRRLLELRNQELARLQNSLAAGDEVQPSAAGAADPGRELESEQVFTDEAEAEIAADAEIDAAAAEAAGGEEAEAVAETERPATSLPPARTTTAASAESPSLLDRIFGALTSTVALIGGGVVLVLAGAFVFLRRRRAEIGDATGQWDALEADLEDDGFGTQTAIIPPSVSEEDDFAIGEDEPFAEEESTRESLAPQAFAGLDAEEETYEAPDATMELGTLQAESDTATMELEAGLRGYDGEPTLSSQTVINLDQADPIAEADFHMAYGLYDQAADLIVKALESDPDNRAYKLKLLEIYFVWGNKDAFLDTARGLRGELGAGGDWAKVVIMGRQICPDEPLFADAGTGAGDVDLDFAADDSDALDLDFEAGVESAVDLELESGESSELDLELGDAESSELDLSFDGDSASGIDLDFGSLADTDLAVDESIEMSGIEAPEIFGAIEEDDYSEPVSSGDVLALGDQTQASLASAWLEEGQEDDSESEAFADIDADGDESPTIETLGASFDLDDEEQAEPTIESQTITEEEGYEIPKVEGPEDIAAETAAMAPTASSATIATAVPDIDDVDDLIPDPTRELDLGDLGLDVAELDALDAGLEEPGDVDDETGLQPGGQDASSLLTASGVTQVLSETAAGDGGDAFGDDEAEHVQTEVLSQPTEIPGGTVRTQRLDLDLDEFSEALQGGDTVEQPRAAGFGYLDDGDDSVDFDLGSDLLDDSGADDLAPLDTQTMTEVGTKLDLARAYIDMGDPEGAKSILEEVLSEGDPGQRQEAQSLIDALSAA